MSDERDRHEHTPSEIELLREEMRAGFQSIGTRFDGVDRRFDGVDQRFDKVDRRLDTMDRRFDAMDGRFDAQDQHSAAADRRLDVIEARITQEATDTRRHFDAVAENLRSDLKVVIDRTQATDQKLARLIASNAEEHAAILEAISDHEVRITSLEKTRADRQPASDRR